MGKDRRKTLSLSRDLPGPGQYDTNAIIDGPKWGFGGASRMPRPAEKDTREYYNIPATMPIAPPYLVTDKNREIANKNMRPRHYK